MHTKISEPLISNISDFSPKMTPSCINTQSLDFFLRLMQNHLKTEHLHMYKCEQGVLPLLLQIIKHFFS